LCILDFFLLLHFSCPFLRKYTLLYTRPYQNATVYNIVFKIKILWLMANLWFYGCMIWKRLDQSLTTPRLVWLCGSPNLSC
jgi:hypothetical protein